VAERWDAVIVGAGPNGLAAACTLADAGRSVLVLEAAAIAGGGARTQALTEPGFQHDVCSAIHPMGAASPFFRAIGLEADGLEWAHPEVALAHPFDDGSAAIVQRDLDATCSALGDEDGRGYRRMIAPLLAHAESLFDETMRPIRIPRRPLLMARFGLRALRSTQGLARAFLQSDRARVMFGAVSAHALLPLDALGTAAFGLMMLIAGHRAGWPCARGGSQSIVAAMIRRIARHGGEVRVGHRVASMADIPSSKVVLFDLTPRQVVAIAGEALPPRYRSRLGRFRYGAGSFKIDWSLDGPIPWKNDACRRAGTVHVVGEWKELAASERAVSEGKISDRPFVLVAQQSLFDRTRAPDEKHTGWGYCHVPHGSRIDATERIEAQIERFAPGFRQIIRARHVIDASQYEAHNANMIGGDIGGGANDLWQVLARPILKWDPYATPNPRLFLCSSSTPPGGGVHGMCGWNAAKSALRRALR
jgi:phytoene dehydrogenase-like protein